MDNIYKWIREAPPVVKDWLKDLQFEKFLRDDLHYNFQMQGMFDGAMSNECKELYRQRYAALTTIQNAIAAETMKERLMVDLTRR